MQPHPQWSLGILVAWLGVHVLAGKHLHNDRLPDGIVDLSLVFIQDAVRLVGQLWLVVAGLGNNDWALVLLLHLLLLERLAVVVEALAYHYPAGVACIRECELILALVDSNDSTAT